MRKKGKHSSFFFALNFWLSLTSTLQQSRIPLSKILDPPLISGKEVANALAVASFPLC